MNEPTNTDLKERLLQHYQQRNPQLFYQFDGFHSESLDDFMIAMSDEDGDALFRQETYELMIGGDVRVLVKAGTSKKDALVLLSKLIGYISKSKDFPLDSSDESQVVGGGINRTDPRKPGGRDETGSPNMDRWKNLSDGASWLEDELQEHPAKRETQSNLEAARAYLEQILSDFPEPEDPASDFEGYAVRRMASALSKALAGEKKRSNRLAIKLNNTATNDPCAICGKRTDPQAGPELFVDGTLKLVCDPCGKKYAPHLSRLLSLGTVADIYAAALDGDLEEPF